MQMQFLCGLLDHPMTGGVVLLARSFAQCVHLLTFWTGYYRVMGLQASGVNDGEILCI